MDVHAVIKFRKAMKIWLFGGVRPRIKVHLRALVHAREAGNVAFAKFIEARMQRKYGIFISHKAHFPLSLDLKHPTGVVVGEGVRLGERVAIYQHVTLGGARTGDWQRGRYPTIGDDTVIFAGAVIVGDITIGKNCIIGANSVVIRDVPDGSTAVGAPARVVDRQVPNPLDRRTENE
ncbi:serine O-acetyltransferase [Microbacterium halimionae]|uniref:Serine O-acetyltransferase n=3 Tax=Microbacterium halimionae TaxID=1526413 RepID=A0A7W3PMD6_9MICO|nr:serine O-acetyltransferase [Microbacterium halimionae]NII94910.1 serine O-acetyltransferase [Microbacterium halimionae]